MTGCQLLWYNSFVSQRIHFVHFIREATQPSRRRTLEEHQGEVDLALSDAVMPRMSGTASLHALRERGLPVRIVMLTGHPLEKKLEDVQARGMIDWLPKPPELERSTSVLIGALNKELN